MMKRQWIVVLGGVACLVAATFLSGLDEAQGKMMHGQKHGGHEQGEQDEHSAHYLKHLLQHAKEIGLTSEQIGKLKAMQLDFKRTEARLEADSKIAKLELHALLEDEQAELSAIQAKVDQLKRTEGALMLAAIKGKRDASALLTPDQRGKDRAHREQMKSEGGGQHGGGMSGMGRGGMGGGAGHGSGQGDGGHQSGMGGMGGGGQAGHDDGDHGSGGSSGAQQHQH